MKLYKVVRYKGYGKLNYIKNTAYVLNSRFLTKSINHKYVLRQIWEEGVEVKINEASQSSGVA